VSAAEWMIVHVEYMYHDVYVGKKTERDTKESLLVFIAVALGNF
jgi:hypothetical protein